MGFGPIDGQTLYEENGKALGGKTCFFEKGKGPFFLKNLGEEPQCAALGSRARPGA